MRFGQEKSRQAELWWRLRGEEVKILGIAMKEIKFSSFSEEVSRQRDIWCCSFLLAGYWKLSAAIGIVSLFATG
jgi:hypothetical protein